MELKRSIKLVPPLEIKHTCL